MGNKKLEIFDLTKGYNLTGYEYFGELYLAQNQGDLAKEYFTKAYNL